MTSSESAEAIRSLLVEYQFSARVEFAATALLVYDYLLTFASERRHIWKPKKTLVFFLFIGLRYSMLFYVLFACVLDFLPAVSTQACSAAAYLLLALNLVNIVSTTGIFILRSYAIWERSRYVLACLLLVALGKFSTTIPIQINERSGERSTAPGHTACAVAPNYLTWRMLQANVICLLAFDVLVVALTVAKTAQQAVSLTKLRKLGFGRAMSVCILRDGVLYFLAIVIMNAGVIACSNSSFQFATYVVLRMEEVLTCILAQRLLLNLRQIDQKRECPTHPSGDDGELSFAYGALLGNIGAPLRDTDEGGMSPSEAHSDTTIDTEDLYFRTSIEKV